MGIRPLQQANGESRALQDNEYRAHPASIITPWKVRMEIEWLFMRPGQNSRRAGNPGYANLGLL